MQSPLPWPFSSLSLLLPLNTSALPLCPCACHCPPLSAPRCVFLPDNGAFFVNYVITAALLGTGMELLRLGSLFLYSTRLFFSRSEPERVHIRKVRSKHFPERRSPSFPREGVGKGAHWKHQVWEAW